MRIFWSFLLFLSLVSCASDPTETKKTTSEIQPVAAKVVRRAVFDFGSGSYRMKIADVDVTNLRIVKVIEIPENLQRTKVDGASDFARQNDGTLSEKLQQQSLVVVKNLVQEAKKNGAQELYGVCTGVYRKAKNAPELIRKWQELGAGVRVIDQDHEAKLAFAGAAAKTKFPKEDLVVWDLGGETMQFSYLVGDKVTDYGLDVASVKFKNMILEKVQHQDIHKVKSPNPLSNADAKSSLLMAGKIAAALPADLKMRLRNPKSKILGAGGVHYFSLRAQLSKPEIMMREKLAELLKLYIANKIRDEDLVRVNKSEYPETDISNLVLVLGFMSQLKIKEVVPVKVDETDALLIEPVSL